MADTANNKLKGFRKNVPAALFALKKGDWTAYTKCNEREPPPSINPK